MMGIIILAIAIAAVHLVLISLENVNGSAILCAVYYVGHQVDQMSM